MKTPFFVLLVTLALLLNACTPAATPAVSQPAIEVSKAVIMADAGTMGGMGMGQSYAGYMQIKNGAAAVDQLLSVTCDFAELTLHETSMNGDVASMKEISGIDIPAGATVELKTGGIHIMFMNLKRDLKVGDSVNLSFKFKNAGVISVTATVSAR